MINIKSKGDELLETRLNEATNPLNISLNIAATEAFCEQIVKEPEGSQIAIRLLAHKIQSPQEKEALYGFAVIDECVKRCGSKFHQEVGKFRFLNELIKVLSPKYMALRTSANVKKRCIECIYGLYKGIPHETKLAEAYILLKKQQIIKSDPTYMDDKVFKVPDPETKRTKSIFETSKDSERLNKLLKSIKPEDIKEANRIIETVVLTDQNRAEQLLKRQCKLEAMHKDTVLLMEMMSRYEPGKVDENNLSTMKDLVNGLEESRSEIFQLSREQNDGELSSEVISRLHDCNSAIKQYNEMSMLDQQEPDVDSESTCKEVTSEDLLGDVRPCDLPSTDLQSIVLPDMYCPQSVSTTNDPVTVPSTTKYDELTNIFHHQNSSNNVISHTGQYKSSYSSMSTNTGSLVSNYVANENNSPDRMAKVQCNAFDDLDVLSQELINIKKKSSNSCPSSNMSQDDELLSSFEERSVNDSLPNEQPLLCDDLALRHIEIIDNYSSDSVLIRDNNEWPEMVTKDALQPETTEPIDLTQYMVNVSTIKPHPLKKPIVIHHDKDTKVKVILHFASDVPHPDVSVLVAQISSENSSPVLDIVLKFAVSKPTRILKEKSSTHMLSAHSPFTPCTPINEVVLLYHPKQSLVDIKYQLSYEIDQDPYLESATTGPIHL